MNDPSGEFRKLDNLLPQRANQSPEDRAREIEGKLDWLRHSQDVVNDDDNGPDGADFSSLSSLPMCKRSPEERARDLSDIMQWIRHKKKEKYVAKLAQREGEG